MDLSRIINSGNRISIIYFSRRKKIHQGSYENFLPHVFQPGDGIASCTAALVSKFFSHWSVLLEMLIEGLPRERDLESKGGFREFII